MTKNSHARKWLSKWVVLLMAIPPITLALLIVWKREAMYQGKPASYWFSEKLRTTHGSSGLTALQYIGKRAVPTIEEAMRSPVERDRHKAVWVAAEMGAAAQDLIPSLNIALNDTAPNVRFHAIESLAVIDPLGERVGTNIILKLEDKNQAVSSEAGRVLNKMERDRAEKGLPPLYKDEFKYAMLFVNSDSPLVQQWGIDKLETIKGREAEVVEALQEIVRSGTKKSKFIKDWARQAITTIGNRQSSEL